MAGSRVTRLAILACVLVVALDLAINGQLTLIFDLGFVLLCVGAALAVRPRDFFHVGVLPPLLLLGLISLVAMVHTPLGRRARRRVHPGRGLGAGAPGDRAAGGVPAGPGGPGHPPTGAPQAEAAGGCLLEARRVPGADPCHARARPSERSTTVVGSEPHSPASITASNQ